MCPDGHIHLGGIPFNFRYYKTKVLLTKVLFGRRQRYYKTKGCQVGPQSGELHWEEPTGLGRESRVLPEGAMCMLEATRTARRLRVPGWRGEKLKGKAGGSLAGT